LKRMIFVLIITLILVSLFGNSKLYVVDGTASYTNFDNVNVNIIKLADNQYRMTPNSGDFSNIPYEQNATTIMLPTFRGIVTSKNDNLIEFYGTENVNNLTIQSFAIQVSTGHAIYCRNSLIQATSGVIDPSDIYVGTIGLVFNLLGVANAFDIEIVSVSQSGMNDNKNETYGQAYTDAGILIVYAHGGNSHVLDDDTTYIGDIVTVSYGANTGANQGSYGDGLEFFFDPGNSQSYSTPQVAGMFAKLNFETGASFDEIRTLLSVIKTALLTTFFISRMFPGQR